MIKSDTMKLTWRLGEPAPQCFMAGYGTAVAHANTAYFSHGYDIYSFTVPDYKWTKLRPCKYKFFGLAVIDGELTTIGGRKNRFTTVTNVLLSLLRGRWSSMNWREVFPPMPTKRVAPAAVTTKTHLVVAGGREGMSDVEILDTRTLQWSIASSLPRPVCSPQMIPCSSHFYFSNDATFLSCSVEELLKSCEPKPTSDTDNGSLWTRLADIPVKYNACVVKSGGNMLAIGGNNKADGDNPTAAIHCYDRTKNTWNVVGYIRHPKSQVLTAVLPCSNEIIVVMGSNTLYLTS